MTLSLWENTCDMHSLCYSVLTFPVLCALPVLYGIPTVIYLALLSWDGMVLMLAGDGVR